MVQEGKVPVNINKKFEDERDDIANSKNLQNELNDLNLTEKRYLHDDIVRRLSKSLKKILRH